MGYALIAYCLLLSLLATHCAPPLPRRSDWKYQDGIEQLLCLYAADWRALGDLVAEASITMREPEGRQKATAFIFNKRPDLFRVDVRGPLLTHIFTVVAQGDSLAVLTAEGDGWKGSSHGSLLSGLTGIDLGRYDLRFALLGLVEPGKMDADWEIQYPRADRAVVALQGEGKSRRLWVDLHRGFVTREECLRADGTLLWYRLLRDYRRVGRLYLPARVEIHQEDSALSLEYNKYEFDRELNEKTFTRGISNADLKRLD